MNMIEEAELNPCSLCGGTPVRESRSNWHFWVKCSDCHSETVHRGTLAEVETEWNAIHPSVPNEADQPLLPVLPVQWVGRIKSESHEDAVIAMQEELQEWRAFGRKFREACTVDPRFIGYDMLLNLARDAARGASLSHVQNEASKILEAVHCHPQRTHITELQERSLALINDLMRFECVRTPDGKAEMYASDDGAYVWFDHVVNTISAPVYADAKTRFAARTDRDKKSNWPNVNTVKDVLEWIADMTDDIPIRNMANAGLRAFAILEKEKKEKQ